MLQYQNDKSIFFHGLAQLHFSLTFPYLTRMGGGFGSTHSLQAALRPYGTLRCANPHTCLQALCFMGRKSCKSKY